MQIAEIDLGKYSNRFSSYTELRLHENRSQSIVLLNGDVVSNARDTTGGVSARVFNGGTWGFSSNPDMSNDAIDGTISAATRNADFLARRCGNEDAALPLSNASADSDFSTKKTLKTQEEKIAFLTEIDNYIVSSFPDVVSRQVLLSCLDMEKKLQTSEGSNGHNVTTRSLIAVKLTTENENKEPVELSEAIGARGQYEDVFESMDTIIPALDKLYAQLLDKKEAVQPISGYHDVILASDLAGILAHEAIGHTTEADIVRAGSVAADYLNKKVASDLITLVDFANTYEGETLPVPIYLDDEGVESLDAVIIEDGVLKSYMHNKDSAQHFGMPLTGNARAFSYTDEPLVRMRNTAILSGSSSLDEMIASIDEGYLLMRPTNGQADSTSEFMFGVQMGYEIKNGKLGKAISDTTISGVAFDMLNNVSMVSDEMVWSCAGMCGKKQPMPVGMGGPAVKTKVYIGGQ
ncbi:TldD/PmbA family protein [Pseudomonadales bacterium]|jgi:TldD protein|nr:TldD/PmbA family protein [Pseudomonadales bacterium]MDB2449596.1 TldD/PmbA family protein [Pseudomonadales bacterium]MDG1835512.1 TldD/PmbA family protein [Pseudomonadales bacterium]